MPLVTMKEILEDTRQKKYAVGMFDAMNLEMTQAIISAAEEAKSPVILALAEMHVKNPDNFASVAGIMVKSAERAKVPVCVHLDHGMSLENIVRAMHLGFSSVMYDGSALPYEENVRNTSQIVTLAKIFGASVEAEIGHVGGAEGGGDDNHGVVLTEPEEAADFEKKTSVDALAVSIGTVHGNYTAAPKLDLNRLTKIRSATTVPLVLHGGSGLSDEDFRNCVRNGISKVNIYTDVVQAAVDRIHCEVNNGCGCEKGSQIAGSLSEEQLVELITQKVLEALGKTSKIKYDTLMERSVDGMKKEIKRKMGIFGSVNKA